MSLLLSTTTKLYPTGIPSEEAFGTPQVEIEGITLRVYSIPFFSEQLGDTLVYADLPGNQVRSAFVRRTLLSWNPAFQVLSPPVQRILSTMIVKIRRGDAHDQTFTLTFTDSGGQEQPYDLTNSVPVFQARSATSTTPNWFDIADMVLVSPAAGVCKLLLTASQSAQFALGNYAGRIRVGDMSWPFSDTIPNEVWIDLVIT